MSGGGGGGGGASRVPIPAGMRKIIQNLKEIAGNHSEDEIYAMLKECAMDPNETAQKLLLQDHFHEVKRKRDKRKEVVREPADPRWRPGGQGRGGRGGRGNFSSRYVSNDAGTKNANSGKENGVSQGLEKGNISLSSTTSDTGSISGIVNGPSNTASHMPSDDTSMLSREESCVETRKVGTVKITDTDVKNVPASEQSLPASDNISSTKTSSSVSGVCASTSDPVLVPSLDMHNPGGVGTIKCVVGSPSTVTEITHRVDSRDVPDLENLNSKSDSDASSSYVHGKQIKSQGSEAQLLDAPQGANSSSLTVPAGSRPSSNHSSHSQQINGPPKAVVANKEWKLKSTYANPVQASGVPDTSHVLVAAEAVVQLQAVEQSISPEETALKLEKRLREVHLDRQHVIIPNHLQVPDSETHGLSFGSFDAGFKLNVDFANGPAIDRSPTPTTEPSQDDEEDVEQPSLSINTESTVAPEMEYANNPASPAQMTEDYSSKEAGVSNIPASQEYDQAKQGPTIAHDGTPFSVVQRAPSYSTFGLIPQMLGSQFAPFESSETQARDNTRIPSFVVQPSFDPSAAYYTQIYRPTADADGRFSPFLAPGGISAKYNGSVAVLPAQTGHSPQESGNSVILSTAGSTPLATQAAGVMQSSITIPQQPVPLFRQPPGVHISHYPPNYIPYNQYLSPLYVQSPGLHHYLSNAAFPQQPPPGGVYPPPGAAASTAPVKYSLPQYKPGTNNGNSAHTGMPTSYETYNSNQAGYTSSTVVSSGNSNGNEDISTSQFKENNVYMTGQQTEGSGVWIPAPGRDMSTLQASSFYGIPPQGQHMTFAPTQLGHGAFGGVYHPTAAVATANVHPLFQQPQTVAGAVEMTGPPAGVYQQPQRGQMNWNSNY